MDIKQPFAIINRLRHEPRRQTRDMVEELFDWLESEEVHSVLPFVGISHSDWVYGITKLRKEVMQ